MTGTAASTSRSSGPGRLIVFLYGVFAVGSVSRAAFQITTKWEHAPLAYTLSAVAAVIYLVATISLAIPGDRSWWVSIVAISTELVGVLAIGTWSLLEPASFPDDTVWSGYGRGYLYIPLVLPLVGLWWLSRTRARSTTSR